MTLSEQELATLLRERAIRLLLLGNGQRIWEASPSPRHQMIVDEVRATIRPRTLPNCESSACACSHLADVCIRLPDGSLVRPDIAIFCTRPPRQQHALTLVPTAIIEVLSPQYETKDLHDLPPVYLANGVLDVLVVDADQRQVTHFQQTEITLLPMPLQIDLQGGCCCGVDV